MIIVYASISNIRASLPSQINVLPFGRRWALEMIGENKSVKLEQNIAIREHRVQKLYRTQLYNFHFHRVGEL